MLVPVSNKKHDRFKEACEAMRSASRRMLQPLRRRRGSTMLPEAVYSRVHVMGYDRSCMVLRRELALTKLETPQREESTQASVLREE